MQKLLTVKWSDNTSVTYYIDKDEFSVAHQEVRSGDILLKTMRGMYMFRPDGSVSMYNGVTRKAVELEWCVSELGWG